LITYLKSINYFIGFSWFPSLIS